VTNEWLLILFILALSSVVGIALVLLIRHIQMNWNRQAEEFVKKDKPEFKRLMRDASTRLRELNQAAKTLEAKSDELKYRLVILQDLVEVSSLYAEKAPMLEEDFKYLLSNVVLAATQSVLPTHRDTRARFLLFRNGELVQYATYMPSGGEGFSGSTFKPGQGAVGTSFEKRSAVLISDTWSDALFQDRDKPHYRSVLCVPVPTTSTSPIGVLNVDAPETGYFTDEHAHLLAAVANVVSLIWWMQFRSVGIQAG
jgi:GAF domain-containing protein